MGELSIIRHPRNATFELTLRCNLHCKMCLFRRADCHNAELKSAELTAAQWESIAIQAAEMGTLSVLLTGGEPMLRDDFCELYENIYRQGFLLELYTNGTLVTPKIMELLSQCPPHSIGMTIYGGSAEAYERVCGNAAAFEKAMAGFKQLASLPSEKKYRTTIIRDNVDDLATMESIVRSELGGGILTHTSEVHAAVRGGESRTAECRLSPQENISFLMSRQKNALSEYLKQKGMPADAIRLTGYEPPRRESEASTEQNGERFTLLGCQAGMDSYTITYDGKMLCCQLLGDFYTEPLSEDLKKAWEDLPSRVSQPEPNPDCSKCSVYEHCITCPAVNLAETGKLNGCPDYRKEEIIALKTCF